MKKNIIYALFTFCFVLFAGNWALGQSQSSNDDIKAVLIDDGSTPPDEGESEGLGNNKPILNQGSCIDVAEYIPILRYMVKLKNLGFSPGDEVPIDGGTYLLPEMYLVAYANNSLSSIVGETPVGQFSSNGQTGLMYSSVVTLYLENLNFFGVGECLENPYLYQQEEFNITFNVTVAYKEDGVFKRYFDIDLHRVWLWPPDHPVNADIVEPKGKICCGYQDYVPGDTSSGLVSSSSDVIDQQNLDSKRNNFSEIDGRDFNNLVTTTIRDINIAPNPFNDFLTIKIPSKSDSEVLIKILDSNGKIVRAITENNLNGENISLNLVDLPNGLYFLECTLSNDKEVYKIIKQ